MYDQFPDLYLNAVGIPEKVRKNISEVLVNALSEAFPDEKEFRILEPGIGLGQITKELWRPLETQRLRAQVYGIDISKEMLQELYLRLQKNGFSRITDTVWQKETLTIRGFKDDFLKWKNSPTSNFHAIFPIFFLHHLYDKWQEGLLKCFSALAPSGIIAVAEDAGDTVVWDGWFQNLDIEPLISNIEKFERRRKFIRLGRIFTEELTKGGHREFLPLRAGYMQPVLHVLDSPLFKKIDKKEFEWESTIKLVDKTEGWLNALEEKALSPLRYVAEKDRKKIMQNIKEEARALFGNLDVEIPIKRKLRLYLYEKLPFSDFESVAKHFVMHVNEAEFVRLGRYLPRPSSPDSPESDIDQKGTLLSIANYGIADKGVEMFHVIRWRDQIESWERNIPVYVYGEKGAAIKTFGKLIAYHSLTKYFIEEREFKGADLIFKDFPEKFVLDTVYVPGPDGFSWSVHYHPTGKLYKLSLFIPKTRDLLPDKAEEIIRKEIKSVKKEDPSCIVAHRQEEDPSCIVNRQMGYIFSHKKLAQRISISSYLRDQTLAGKLSIDEKQIESIKDALLGWIDFQEFFTGNKLWKSCRDKLENFARILVCGQVLGDRILYYPIATFLNGKNEQHSSGGYIFIGSKDMSVKGNALLNYGGLTFRSRSVGDWAEKASQKTLKRILGLVAHDLVKDSDLVSQVLGKGYPEFAKEFAASLTNKSAALAYIGEENLGKKLKGEFKSATKWKKLEEHIMLIFKRNLLRIAFDKKVHFATKGEALWQDTVEQKEREYIEILKEFSLGTLELLPSRFNISINLKATAILDNFKAEANNLLSLPIPSFFSGGQAYYGELLESVFEEAVCNAIKFGAPSKENFFKVDVDLSYENCDKESDKGYIWLNVKNYVPWEKSQKDLNDHIESSEKEAVGLIGMKNVLDSAGGKYKKSFNDRYIIPEVKKISANASSYGYKTMYEVAVAFPYWRQEHERQQ